MYDADYQTRATMLAVNCPVAMTKNCWTKP